MPSLRLRRFAAALVATTFAFAPFADLAVAQQPKPAPAKPPTTAAPKQASPAKPDAPPKPPAPPKPQPATPAKPPAPPKPPAPAKPGLPKKEEPKLPDPPPVSSKLSGVDRWVDATPEAVVQLAMKRAEAGGDDALAGLLLAASMIDHAPPGEVLKAFTALSKSGGPAGHEAGLLAQVFTPSPFGKTWDGWSNVKLDVPKDARGIVRAVTVIGPIQDPGGGVARRDGPEADGASFAEMDADYSWGDFEVRPRRVVPDWVTTYGIPLDLYVFPRTESCTYVASKVTFPDAPKSVVVRVAAAGSARVMWDGETVAWSEDVNARGLLDRLAASIELDPGAHLVAVKVCSSPLPDEGRVRIRFTDEAGSPIAVEASSDLSDLPKDRAVGAPLPAALSTKAPSSAASGAPAKPKAAPAAPKAPAPKGPAAPVAAKVRSKPVKTMLQLALEGDGRSNDHALVAAVARTSAGADDTRSPRAPGLLDRVAKNPAASPDQLALCGWLSAFGANKSGWLNLALEKGLASGDKRSASFAQRRLVESLLTGGALDSTLRLISKAPLSEENDVAARVLRAGIIGRTRSQLDALNALIAIDDELKQKIPTATLRELVNFSSARPELKPAFQRRLAQISLSGRDASFAAGALNDGNAAYERAVAQVVPHVSSARALIGLASSLQRRDRYSWARELAFVATKVGPNIADSWEVLASARDAVILDEKQRGVPATDDERYAQQARQRSLALRRGDAQKKAEIAFRDGAYDKKGEIKQKGDDERFLTDGATIVARAKKSPAVVGEVFERTLHFQRVVTYHPDKRVSQLIHQAREIVVEPRTPNELYERQIPSEGDQVELVLARVHRKDGTIAQPDEQSSVGAYIKWPQLKTGDVVEFVVRSWTSQPVGRRGDPPFYFIDYVGSTSTRPVLFNEVIVEAPEDSQLGIDVINGKPEKAEDKIDKGKRVVRYTWDNPPIVADEPLSPSQTELTPLVIGSTFRSWDDFRTWYQTAIDGMTNPDDQVKQLAADLTKGKKTEKEKLNALFNYVADDIRYVNYTSGEFWLPNRPQQLLARRQGDCDDKAILLIALLKSIGVEATPVLVQTRLTGMPSILMGTKAAVPFFDHGIAYLPGKNGAPGTWLDATSPQSRIGPLPSMDARAKALFVYEGEAKIIDTPSSSPNDNGTSLEWTVKLDASGRAELKGNEKHMGDLAFELRNNLSEPDARAQWVEQYLGRWVPTVDLDGDLQYSADDGTLAYAAKVEGYARREGDELAIPTMGSFSFMAIYAPLAKRTLPVVLPPHLGPSHDRRKITITAPAGYSFKELPPGGEAKGGAFGNARVSFKQGKTPGTILIETEVVFDKSTIPVAEYPAFRKWLESVDTLIRQMVRLTPTTPGAAAPAKAPAAPAKAPAAPSKAPAPPPKAPTKSAPPAKP
ncbi:MAG: transglutaminase domain-containing protein [Polyangiaceae bacterium]|nr:transglutaminase domain-containing protein [Polyangiaceae bacterium]